MERQTTFGGMAALVVIGLIIGIGLIAFQLGANQGFAQGALQGVLSAGSEGAAPLAPGFGLLYSRPYGGFGGFGLLGCLIPFLLVFLFFGILRMFLWRGPHSWGRYPKWAGQENGPEEPHSYEAPPFIAEWHRRMHEAERERSAGPEETDQPADQ